MKRIADAIFDAGSYALFLPYVLRPDEEVKSACADMQEKIAQYNDSADIPYFAAGILYRPAMYGE